MIESEVNANANQHEYSAFENTLKLIQICLFVEVTSAACALMGMLLAGWLLILAATSSMGLAFRLAVPVFQPPAGWILAGANFLSWLALMSIPVMLVSGGVSELHFRAVVIARSIGLLITLGINLGTRQYLVTRTNT